MGETGGGTRRDIWRGARGERVGNGGGGSKMVERRREMQSANYCHLFNIY